MIGPRILCLTPEPWPTFRADVAILLGREMPKSGITVDLVTARNPSVPWHDWPGGETHLCHPGPGRFWKHVVRTWHVLRQLARVSARKYDAVQVRDMPLVATLAIVFGAFRGLPVIYWMSYPISRGLLLLARERRREGMLIRWWPTWLRGAVGLGLLRTVVLRRASFVVVQSERMRDELVALGVPATRLLPMPMGVDVQAVERTASAARAKPLGSARPIVAYLGTLDRPRRIDLLIEMAALLRQTTPDVLLLLVGDTHDGVHRRRLDEQIDRLSLRDHVRITGWLPTEQAWERILPATVALSPFPRGELLDSASPTKVPEYLAFGIPVVCNDNPDQRSIIEACGAGSCVPLTAEDFASAVLFWLQMPEDERQRRADAGRLFIQRHRDYPLLARGLATEYQRRIPVGRTAA